MRSRRFWNTVDWVGISVSKSTVHIGGTTAHAYIRLGSFEFGKETRSKVTILAAFWHFTVYLDATEKGVTLVNLNRIFRESNSQFNLNYE